MHYLFHRLTQSTVKSLSWKASNTLILSKISGHIFKTGRRYLTWARWIQSTISNQIFPRSILLFSSCLSQGLLRDSPSGFINKSVYALHKSLLNTFSYVIYATWLFLCLPVLKLLSLTSEPLISSRSWFLSYWETETTLNDLLCQDGLAMLKVVFRSVALNVTKLYFKNTLISPRINQLPTKKVRFSNI
jgi:hypothetical protein